MWRLREAEESAQHAPLIIRRFTTYPFTSFLLIHGPQAFSSSQPIKSTHLVLISKNALKLDFPRDKSSDFRAKLWRYSSSSPRTQGLFGCGGPGPALSATFGAVDQVFLGCFFHSKFQGSKKWTFSAHLKRHKFNLGLFFRKKYGNRQMLGALQRPISHLCRDLNQNNYIGRSGETKKHPSTQFFIYIFTISLFNIRNLSGHFNFQY